METLVFSLFHDFACGMCQVFQVKRLIDDLCKAEKLEGMKYTYWDECYTSQVGAFSLQNVFAV